MALIDRVKNILLTPKTEWPAIAGESSSTAELFVGYVAPLAGIAALCGFVGGSLVGFSVPLLGTMRTPVLTGIGMAVFSFAMAFVGIFVLSLIINALAPSFGAQKNPAQALKVAVYAYTPAWIAGILQILPMLSLLGVLISLYGIYLLYLGLPLLMRNPEEKSLGYTAVVVLCAIVVGFAISLVAGLLGGVAGGGMGMMGAARDESGSAGTLGKESPIGKLESLGKQMEDAGRKIDAAQKSGDQHAQVKAAMEGLGAVLGGGKRFEPLPLDTLKPLVPETLGGLARKEQSSERGGMPGLQISKVEARYGDDPAKSIRLEITDSGGAAGLMGFAGWMGMMGEKENDRGIERTRKEGDRLVHEKISKTGGENEYTIVVGNRFIVEATGRGVPIDQLQAAVASLGLARLEALKEAGAIK